MVLENKLGITSSSELANVEEKIRHIILIRKLIQNLMLLNLQRLINLLRVKEL